MSADTLRRWERAGKLTTARDEANRRRVPQAEVNRLAARPERHRSGDELSARNRFPGVVRSVEVDGVMALVEIEAGPHLVTAAVTRDAVDELGLAPGVPATATVKATSVMVQRTSCPMRSRCCALARRARSCWLAGCGDDESSSGDGKPRLTVSAATSLTNAFEEYGGSFDAATARFSFAGSDELAAQIRQGVKPDVYAAANTKLPDQLFDEELVEKPVRFAGNRLVIAVAKGRDDIKELERPGRGGPQAGHRRRVGARGRVHARGAVAPPERRERGHPRQRALRGARRGRRGRASSRRARPMPASSTSPT